MDSDKDFNYRNIKRVDIAHQKATEFLDKRKIFYKNIGFDPKEDKIPTEIWWKVPNFIRKTPDMFIVTDKGFALLEIKGCRDSLKIKIEDYIQYLKWNEAGRLMFFCYSTTKEARYLFPLKALEQKFKDSYVGQYEDNKKFYLEINLKALEGVKR